MCSMRLCWYEAKWSNLKLKTEPKQLLGRFSTGSAKANGREPKTCLGRVFNYKLGCSDNVHVIMYTDAHPYL
jgi:hypothetical protein